MRIFGHPVDGARRGSTWCSRGEAAGRVDRAGQTGRVRWVAAAQAAYYVPTALAPLVSRRRFEAVTGPKREWWLVVTVSSLVGTIGSVLGLAACRRRRPLPSELQLLGGGAAAGLALVDALYVARRRISPVYLVDAAIQLGLVAAYGWIVCGTSRRVNRCCAQLIASVRRPTNRGGSSAVDQRPQRPTSAHLIAEAPMPGSRKDQDVR